MPVGLFGPPNVEKLNARGNIEGLVRATRYRRDPELAERARQALEDKMDWLIRQLASRNLRAVLISRDALAAIGEPAAKELVACLDSPQCERRQDAVHALGEVGGPTAVQGLITATSDNDTLVRVLAVRAMARLGDPALKRYVELALNDPDDAVRHNAKKALKHFPA